MLFVGVYFCDEVTKNGVLLYFDTSFTEKKKGIIGSDNVSLLIGDYVNYKALAYWYFVFCVWISRPYFPPKKILLLLAQ